MQISFEKGKKIAKKNSVVLEKDINGWMPLCSVEFDTFL